MGKTSYTTDQQKLFIDAYCTYRHGTKAARVAGYKNPGEYASELLRSPKYVHVQEEIRTRLASQSKELEHIRHALVDRAIQIAFFDPRKVLDKKGKLLPLDQIDPEDSSCLSSITTKEYEGGCSVSAKFINPLPAIKLLFEAAGLDRPADKKPEDDFSEKDLDEALQAKYDRIKAEYDLRKEA